MSSMVSSLGPITFTPTGVRIPVVIMSIRVRIGNSQAFANEGICTARSSCSINASQLIGSSSGHHLANCVLSHGGAQVEYQRVLRSLRHWFSGFNTTVVSTMLIGAGSVAVSDLPILPYTL